MAPQITGALNRSPSMAGMTRVSPGIYRNAQGQLVPNKGQSLQPNRPQPTGTASASAMNAMPQPTGSAVGSGMVKPPGPVPFAGNRPVRRLPGTLPPQMTQGMPQTISQAPTQQTSYGGASGQVQAEQPIGMPAPPWTQQQANQGQSEMMSDEAARQAREMEFQRMQEQLKLSADRRKQLIYGQTQQQPMSIAPLNQQQPLANPFLNRP